MRNAGISRGLSAEPRFVWIGRLGAMLLRLLGSTWRLQWRVDPAAEELVREKRPVVYAVWHEAILVGIWVFRGRDITVMVSQSKDGEIISQIIHHLGYATARGSSTRGGGRALLEIARIGRRGGCLAITPDGPRGPRRRLQPGTLLIAQRAGLPLVPLAFGARGAKRLGSGTAC
ncbi:MAG: lysophospholipid acyltransferase family protein [Candidatus Eisenbacteria bacterium]